MSFFTWRDRAPPVGPPDEPTDVEREWDAKERQLAEADRAIAEAQASVSEDCGAKDRLEVEFEERARKERLADAARARLERLRAAAPPVAAALAAVPSAIPPPPPPVPSPAAPSPLVSRVLAEVPSAAAAAPRARAPVHKWTDAETDALKALAVKNNGVFKDMVKELGVTNSNGQTWTPERYTFTFDQVKNKYSAKDFIPWRTQHGYAPTRVPGRAGGAATPAATVPMDVDEGELRPPPDVTMSLQDVVARVKAIAARAVEREQLDEGMVEDEDLKDEQSVRASLRLLAFSNGEPDQALINDPDQTGRMEAHDLFLRLQDGRLRIEPGAAVMGAPPRAVGQYPTQFELRQRLICALSAASLDGQLLKDFTQDREDDSADSLRRMIVTLWKSDKGDKSRIPEEWKIQEEERREALAEVLLAAIGTKATVGKLDLSKVEGVTAEDLKAFAPPRPSPSAAIKEKITTWSTAVADTVPLPMLESVLDVWIDADTPLSADRAGKDLSPEEAYALTVNVILGGDKESGTVAGGYWSAKDPATKRACFQKPGGVLKKIGEDEEGNVVFDYPNLFADLIDETFHWNARGPTAEALTEDNWKSKFQTITNLQDIAEKTPRIQDAITMIQRSIRNEGAEFSSGIVCDFPYPWWWYQRWDTDTGLFGAEGGEAQLVGYSPERNTFCLKYLAGYWGLSAHKETDEEMPTYHEVSLDAADVQATWDAQDEVEDVVSGKTILPVTLADGTTGAAVDEKPKRVLRNAQELQGDPVFRLYEGFVRKALRAPIVHFVNNLGAKIQTARDLPAELQAIGQRDPPTFLFDGAGVLGDKPSDAIELAGDMKKKYEQLFMSYEDSTTLWDKYRKSYRSPFQVKYLEDVEGAMRNLVNMFEFPQVKAMLVSDLIPNEVVYKRAFDPDYVYETVPRPTGSLSPEAKRLMLKIDAAEFERLFEMLNVRAEVHALLSEGTVSTESVKALLESYPALSARYTPSESAEENFNWLTREWEAADALLQSTPLAESVMDKIRESIDNPANEDDHHTQDFLSDERKKRAMLATQTLRIDTIGEGGGKEHVIDAETGRLVVVGDEDESGSDEDDASSSDEEEEEEEADMGAPTKRVTRSSSGSQSEGVRRSRRSSAEPAPAPVSNTLPDSGIWVRDGDAFVRMTRASAKPLHPGECIKVYSCGRGTAETRPDLADWDVRPNLMLVEVDEAPYMDASHREKQGQLVYKDLATDQNYTIEFDDAEHDFVVERAPLSFPLRFQDKSISGMFRRHVNSDALTPHVILECVEWIHANLKLAYPDLSEGDANKQPRVSIRTDTNRFENVYLMPYVISTKCLAENAAEYYTYGVVPFIDTFIRYEQLRVAAGALTHRLYDYIDCKVVITGLAFNSHDGPEYSDDAEDVWTCSLPEAMNKLYLKVNSVVREFADHGRLNKEGRDAKSAQTRRRKAADGANVHEPRPSSLQSYEVLWVVIDDEVDKAPKPKPGEKPKPRPLRPVKIAELATDRRGPDFRFQTPPTSTLDFRLDPHQVLNVLRFKRQHLAGRGLLIADEPGLGKTYSAIACACECAPEDVASFRVLIVCPKNNVRDPWETEIKKVTTWDKVGNVFINTVNSGTEEERTAVLSSDRPPAWIVMNYDRLTGMKGEEKAAFDKLAFHCVIFDEAHIMKNGPKSAKWVAAKAILGAGAGVVALTGTPWKNKLTDICSLAALVRADPADDPFFELPDTWKSVRGAQPAFTVRAELKKRAPPPLEWTYNSVTQETQRDTLSWATQTTGRLLRDKEKHLALEKRVYKPLWVFRDEFTHSPEQDEFFKTRLESAYTKLASAIIKRDAAKKRTDDDDDDEPKESAKKESPILEVLVPLRLVSTAIPLAYTRAEAAELKALVGRNIPDMRLWNHLDRVRVKYGVVQEGDSVGLVRKAQKPIKADTLIAIASTTKEVTKEIDGVSVIVTEELKQKDKKQLEDTFKQMRQMATVDLFETQQGALIPNALIPRFQKIAEVARQMMNDEYRIDDEGHENWGFDEGKAVRVGAGQRKVLIFGSYEMILNPLAEYLRQTFGLTHLPDILDSSEEHLGHLNETLTAAEEQDKQVPRKLIVARFEGKRGQATMVPDPRPFLLINIASGSVGLNLQARASGIIFATPEYSSVDHTQAIARAWRRGQSRDVRVSFIIPRGIAPPGKAAPKTVEYFIYDKMNMKRRNAEQVYTYLFRGVEMGQKVSDSAIKDVVDESDALNMMGEIRRDYGVKAKTAAEQKAEKAQAKKLATIFATRGV